MWEHSSMCEPATRSALSLCLAHPSKGLPQNTGLGLRENKLSTAGKEKEAEEEEGCTKHLGLSQSLVCNTGKLCSELVHNV